jgi:general stress protein 26
MAATSRKKPIARTKSGNLDELWKLVEGIETAMMTTHRPDGMLVSRPMATQKRAAGADFWFVTAQGFEKLNELAGDPRVNLAYYRDRTREWVSISGVAEISHDRAKIRELHAPDWRAWFPDEGGKSDGGPDDPRMVLIGVHARSAQYLAVDKPQPILLFEFVKGMVTGRTPDWGKVKRVAMGRKSAGERVPARRGTAPRSGGAAARKTGAPRRRPATKSARTSKSPARKAP